MGLVIHPSNILSIYSSHIKLIHPTKIYPIIQLRVCPTKFPPIPPSLIPSLPPFLQSKYQKPKTRAINKLANKVCLPGTLGSLFNNALLGQRRRGSWSKRGWRLRRQNMQKSRFAKHSLVRYSVTQPPPFQRNTYSCSTPRSRGCPHLILT